MNIVKTRKKSMTMSSNQQTSKKMLQTTLMKTTSMMRKRAPQIKKTTTLMMTYATLTKIVSRFSKMKMSMKIRSTVNRQPNSKRNKSNNLFSNSRSQVRVCRAKK
jgi:hypothetical protein